MNTQAVGAGRGLRQRLGIAFRWHRLGFRGLANASPRPSANQTPNNVIVVRDLSSLVA